MGSLKDQKKKSIFLIYFTFQTILSWFWDFGRIFFSKIVKSFWHGVIWEQFFFRFFQFFPIRKYPLESRLWGMWNSKTTSNLEKPNRPRERAQNLWTFATGLISVGQSWKSTKIFSLLVDLGRKKIFRPKIQKNRVRHVIPLIWGRWSRCAWL